MRAKHTLLSYLDASGKAGHCPELCKQLRKEDYAIPDLFTNTVEYCLMVDEMKRAQEQGEDAFNDWRDTKGAKQFAGLNGNEANNCIGYFLCPQAELVTQDNHPRLQTLFHKMCDEMGVVDTDPQGNKLYPRLILAKSDLFNAFVLSRNEHQPVPALILSEALVEGVSSRMVETALSHEILHIKRERERGPNRFIRGLEARIEEEYVADVQTFRFGGNADEAAQLLLEVDERRAATKRAATELMEFVRTHQPNSRDHYFLKSAPELIRTMQSIIDQRLIMKEPPATDVVRHPRRHPYTMDRFDHVFATEDKVELAPVPWKQRLADEYAQGGLLGKF